MTECDLKMLDIRYSEDSQDLLDCSMCITHISQLIQTLPFFSKFSKFYHELMSNVKGQIEDDSSQLLITYQKHT